MSRKLIEQMTQKEFFISLKNEIVNCINSELNVKNPHFYFNFTETNQSVEKYKERLITVRTKLGVFDFDRSPASYIIAVTSALEFLGDSNPILKSNYYRFSQQRFDYHIRTIACIMRDNIPLNRFDYKYLVEPVIKFSELEKYMNDIISTDDYQSLLTELRKDPKEQSPLPYQFLLLELTVRYMANVNNREEIRKIIAVSFNVSREKEITETFDQLLAVLHAVPKLIEKAPPTKSEVKAEVKAKSEVNGYDLVKMKSEGIKELVKGIEYFAKKTYGSEGLNKEGVKHAQQLKKLCTLLESKDPLNERDQIDIAGIINYILENGFGNFFITNSLLLVCLTDDFRSQIADKDEDVQEKLFTTAFEKIAGQCTSLPYNFFDSFDSDDDAGPPDQKEGTDTAPPSPRS